MDGDGRSCGTAAHLAIAGGVQPREVSIETLQRALADRGQVLTYFKDIDHKHPAFAAMQFFGTKGFFSDYLARPEVPMNEGTAKRWIGLAGVKADVRWTGLTRGEVCRQLYKISRIGAP